MLGMCTSVPENFPEPKFCQRIQVDGMINLAEYFSNQFARMSLAIGRTLLLSVQTVGADHDCCYTEILW